MIRRLLPDLVSHLYLPGPVPGPEPETPRCGCGRFGKMTTQISVYLGKVEFECELDSVSSKFVDNLGRRLSSNESVHPPFQLASPVWAGCR